MFRVNRQPEDLAGQFATSLIFPLAGLRLGDLDADHWLPGPWEPDVEHVSGSPDSNDASSGFSSKDRRLYFSNPDVVRPYLRKKYRRHRHCDVTDHRRTLRVDAIEVVRVPEGWNESRFLLVHLVAIGSDPKMSLATLATLARPRTIGWYELANQFDLVGGEGSGLDPFNLSPTGGIHFPFAAAASWRKRSHRLARRHAGAVQAGRPAHPPAKQANTES